MSTKTKTLFKDVGIIIGLVGLAITVLTMASSFGASSKHVEDRLDNLEPRMNNVEKNIQETHDIAIESRTTLKDIANYMGVPTKSKP
jgi:hypothetical protein